MHTDNAFSDPRDHTCRKIVSPHFQSLKIANTQDLTSRHENVLHLGDFGEYMVPVLAFARGKERRKGISDSRDRTFSGGASYACRVKPFLAPRVLAGQLDIKSYEILRFCCLDQHLVGINRPLQSQKTGKLSKGMTLILDKCPIG